MKDDDQFEDLEDAVDELLLLWPHLPGALQRDEGAGGERVSGGGVLSSTPVNPEVLSAIGEIFTDVWPVEIWCRTLLHETPTAHTITDAIRSMPATYRRLRSTNAHREAARLASRVFRWRRVARRAVGLTRPAQQVIRNGKPVVCPLHDDPRTILLQPGLEGELRPGGPEAIVWRRTEQVHCPHCNARWTPAEYGLLGRLVDTAEQRRATVS